MNKPATHLVLTGLLMLLLAGCAAPSPQVTYYSLYVPAQQPSPARQTATAPLVVSIGPVTIPDILKQAQIATGGADGRYQLSDNHRWSGELDRDFARAVAEQLADTLGTEQVAIFPWDQQFKPTYRVLLDVLSMGGGKGRRQPCRYVGPWSTPRGRYRSWSDAAICARYSTSQAMRRGWPRSNATLRCLGRKLRERSRCAPGIKDLCGFSSPARR